jgi:hypothetical protein
MNEVIAEHLDGLLEPVIKAIQERWNCSQTVARQHLAQRTKELWDECFPDGPKAGQTFDAPLDLATAIANDLFTSGIEEEGKAKRLVMEFDGKPLDGTGWSESAVTTRINRHLPKAPPP